MYRNTNSPVGHVYMYVHVRERVCVFVFVCPGTKESGTVAARLQAGSRLIHTEPECCPTALGMDAWQCVCACAYVFMCIF